MKKLSSVLCVFIVFVLIVHFSCERKTSPASPNLPPNTTLANIPVDDDTLFALVTLHWDGEDYDGFISGYQYRYITKHLFAGDSVVQEWVFTTETSVTIPFESSDNLNYQRFQVRAVDDGGGLDPTPAERKFYTVQTIFPETEILYFTPLDGPHQIMAISRDNTNLVDPVGDTITVLLVEPSFEREILIIDETDEALFTGGLGAYKDKDALVDSFYTDIFGTSDAWDFQSNGMPPKSLLGQYKLVIWHADNPYSNERDVHKLPAHIEDIKDYLHVGGDFIMGGWRILKSFAQSEAFPKAFEEGTFIHDYLHILEADESILIPTDFNGCTGFSGFSDVKVDSVKLAEFPYFGKLGQINVMPRRAGFTDVIYTYANELSGLPNWRGEPTGIRYYGTSFNTIVLGFPLFFVDKSDAFIMADEMLHSLGYR
ncbi:hypothetical protein B1H10_01280 [candidate division KSB1 bacterium 4484_188]|nr:MAG: hypothetical protein B1H10_01280 [candidate division KSB1 bacterium 4484_188]